MWIMTWGSTKTTVVVQAGQDKIDEFTLGQSIGLAKKIEGCQAPVDATEAQVFGEPVVELIFALPCRQHGSGLRDGVVR